MSTSLLHPFTPPRMDDFINLVGGRGAIVWDENGKEYIDGMASLWYVNIGHGREEMAEAIAQQARTLAAYHVFDPYTNPASEEAAAKIASLSPFENPRVFFGSSGSEAVDTAMKLARVAQVEAGYPERQIIISRERGYHGTNFGGTSAQGIPSNRDGFGPLVGDVVCVAADDLAAVEQVFVDNPGRVAAVLSELVQGASGVWPPEAGYLSGLRKLCDEHGAFLIADEVISGFGRLGTWFGSQFYGVVPDMITFAKAVTSGYVPFSGVIIGPAVRAALEAREGFVLRTGYTYSGHPVGAVAALKAIEIQEREDLLSRGVRIGKYLEVGLRKLFEDGLLTDVRGEGAVWGVTVPEGVDPFSVRDGLLEHGVILRPIPGGHMALCPPLVITEEQIDQLTNTMQEVLTKR